MEARGLMTAAGRDAIKVAQANGWWTISEQVEDLIDPPDLIAALDRFTGARAAWNAFPPSARKQMLWTIVSAAREETRAARIERIATEAAEGRRALG